MKNEEKINIDLKTILSKEFKKIWNNFTTGVFVTDEKATILYLNPAQECIDNLKSEKILGKKVTDVYSADENFSITKQCIRKERAIRDYSYFYYIYKNNMVHSMSSIFPLFENEKLVGTISFVNSVAVNQNIFNELAKNPPHKKTKKRYKFFTFDDIIGNEYQFKNIIEIAKQSSQSDSPVLIWGESGVGKELFAQSIHNASKRKKKPFIPINCAAIPEPLLEGLLFGTTKGAFTGAVEKTGLLESANGGTILFDELNSMPLNLQAKMLRALQEKKIRKVGAIKETSIDIRIISLLNINPKQALAETKLREDLFYRIGVVILKIPPLRKRKLDIPLLCPAILKKHRHITQNKVHIDDKVYTMFFNYNWPGNVRELEHVIEGSLNILGKTNKISKQHVISYFSERYTDFKDFSTDNSASTSDNRKSFLTNNILELTNNILEKQLEINFALQKSICLAQPLQKSNSTDMDKSHDEIGSLKSYLSKHEKNYIQQALAKTDRNICKSARLLKVSPQNLHHKIKKYDI